MIPSTRTSITYIQSAFGKSVCGSAGAEPLWAAKTQMAHCAAIRRLCWTRMQDDAIQKKDDISHIKQHCLASCGEDHMVRIYKVQ